MKKMETMHNSKSSLNLSSNWQKSNGKGNLNNVMIMSIEDEILSNSSDDSFYDTLESLPSFQNSKTEIDTSVAINEKQNIYFSHLFDNTEPTRLFSLPRTKINSDDRDSNDVNDSVQNANDLQLLQDTDIKKENHMTNKHIPLPTLLRRMFDEILKKHSNSTKQSNTTCSNKSSINEPLLNNSNLTNKLNNIFKISNNNSVCQIQEFNGMATTSVENVKNSSKINISPPKNTSFLKKLLPKKLFTILENSNESFSISQLQDSFDCSGKHIGKLANFSSKKLERNHCISRNMFITSDMYDTETSISSNISNDAGALNEEVIETAKNLQRKNALNLITHNTENETNSLYSEYEESIHFSFMDKKEKKKSPIKKNKKRKSLSEPNNNKGAENSEKLPWKANFSYRTNMNIKFNTDSLLYSAKSISSYDVNTSPIKSVKYLRNFFTNIANKSNRTRSPRRTTIKRPKIPFIFVTPASPC